MLFPIISSVEVGMKTDFSQGETLIAKISGNFLTNILFENVFFYRGHVRVPFLYDVAKINNEFYIYALLPQTPNNYSLVIKNVEYMKGAEITDTAITSNFSISDNTADFSVYPGFIVADEDFFIKVQNLKDNKINIEVSSDLFEKDEQVTLISGEIKKIYFSVENITESTFGLVKLKSENSEYEIPVYVFVTGNTDPDCIPDCFKKECGNDKCGGSCGICESGDCIDGICGKILKFSPSEAFFYAPTNYNYLKTIYFYNLGKNNLLDLSFSVSENLEDYISLSIEEVEELESGSNIEIELTLFSETEISINGEIRAETNNEIVSFPVSLNFIKDYEPSDNPDDFGSAKICSELDGVICNSDEECSGELVYAKDDRCCLDTCEKIKKSSLGKIIGWIILVLIVVALIWFFKIKLKKGRKKIDLLGIVKKK